MTNMKETNFLDLVTTAASENLITIEDVNGIFKEIIEKIILDIDPEQEIEIEFDKDSASYIKIFNNTISILKDGKKDKVIDQYMKEHGEIFETCFVKLEDFKKHPEIYGKYEKNHEFFDFEPLPETRRIDITEKFLKYPKKFLTMFRQKISQRKKQEIYKIYKEQEGKKVQAIVTNFDNDKVVLKLVENPAIELIMLKGKFDPGIKYYPNKQLEVTIEEVLEETKMIQIVAKNTSLEEKLEDIKAIVPEYRDGIVEIKKAVREMGFKTKIAVVSHNDNVNPVGSFIGSNGNRIKAISKIFQDEKVEILLWHDDVSKLIVEALSPAKVISVVPNWNGEKNCYLVVTPNIHQTLAIGKKGLNIKLCAKLTGTKINVLSFQEAKDKNIHLAWNGNVENQLDLEKIERGEVVLNSFKRNSQNNRNWKSNFGNMDEFFQKESTTFNEQLLEDDFDHSFFKQDFKKSKSHTSFKNNSMNENPIEEMTEENNITSNNLDNFTDEELREMEEKFNNFDLDDDLLQYE